MSTIQTVEEIFAIENLDVNAITIGGIPERHIEAVKAIAKLFVVVDYHNPNFQPDFLNYEQDKISPVHKMGSPSGVGFSYYVYGHWDATSVVGSRLVSESVETTKLIAENYPELYEKFMVYQRELKK